MSGHALPYVFFLLCAFLLNREIFLSHMLLILKYSVCPCPKFAYENTRMNFKYRMSFVCFHILPYRLLTVYFFSSIQWKWVDKTEMIKRNYLFPKILPYIWVLTYMAVFSSVCQLTYLENFLIPVGCLGWCRQYIHLLSAATFTELRATFSKIAAVKFFLLLPNISCTSNFYNSMIV